MERLPKRFRKLARGLALATSLLLPACVSQSEAKGWWDAPDTPKPVSMEVIATCTSGHIYGEKTLGPHIDLRVKAQGFKAEDTPQFDGLWLYAADITASQGYYPVGYNRDRDTFPTLFHERVNSIRGTETVEFKPEHIISMMIRRGNYTEGFPVTDFAAKREVRLPDCTTKPSSLLRRFFPV